MVHHGNILTMEPTRELHGEAHGFSDATWASGNAQLVIVDGDEATVVSYGPDANNKIYHHLFP